MHAVNVRFPFTSPPPCPQYPVLIRPMFTTFSTSPTKTLHAKAQARYRDRNKETERKKAQLRMRTLHGSRNEEDASPLRKVSSKRLRSTLIVCRALFARYKLHVQKHCDPIYGNLGDPDFLAAFDHFRYSSGPPFDREDAIFLLMHRTSEPAKETPDEDAIESGQNKKDKKYDAHRLGVHFDNDHLVGLFVVARRLHIHSAMRVHVGRQTPGKGDPVIAEKDLPEPAVFETLAMLVEERELGLKKGKVFACEMEGQVVGMVVQFFDAAGHWVGGWWTMGGRQGLIPVAGERTGQQGAPRSRRPTFASIMSPLLSSTAHLQCNAPNRRPPLTAPRPSRSLLSPRLQLRSTSPRPENPLFLCGSNLPCFAAPAYIQAKCLDAPIDEDHLPNRATCPLPYHGEAGVDRVTHSGNAGSKFYVCCPARVQGVYLTVLVQFPCVIQGPGTEALFSKKADANVKGWHNGQAIAVLKWEDAEADMDTRVHLNPVLFLESVPLQWAVKGITDFFPSRAEVFAAADAMNLHEIHILGNIDEGALQAWTGIIV
ncbi:hypothetical protein B0H19DRAFT_1075171 [Mycena capillaripes]|nr:hypothetical protein B0H19DRAFT_1075171 [Mycena capillaripes]